MEFKMFGKRYRIREFSPLWWAGIIGGATALIGGSASWYFVLYMLSSNPM